MTDILSEHIQYLSLPHRSDLYRAAISQSIQAGSSVADLGCGVGVLGIFCLEAGAGHVFGIDNSDAIHLAEETVRRAGLDDRYTCIADSSFHAALDERVDAIVCDHVGYFGIDYGIVDMVRDAARRMLKPGGAIIPDQIQLHIAGVCSDACHDKAAAWSDTAVPQAFRWIDSQARNAKYPHDFDPNELCSDAAEIGAIELNAETPEYFAFNAELTVTRAGRFDGLAGWFNAHLGGGVWMTNSPLEAKSIKRHQAFFPVAQPFDVKVGQRIAIRVKARSDGNFLAWMVTPPDGKAVQKQSTWASTIHSKQDMMVRSTNPVELTSKAQASAYVLSLVDGSRTASEIEEIVMQDRPHLMPSPQATLDFVRNILKHSTSS